MNCEQSQAAASKADLTLSALLNKRSMPGHLMPGLWYLVSMIPSSSSTGSFLACVLTGQQSNYFFIRLQNSIGSFPNISTNLDPEYSGSRYPGSKIYSVLQGWLHWHPWRLFCGGKCKTFLDFPFNSRKAEQRWKGVAKTKCQCSILLQHKIVTAAPLQSRASAHSPD